jgi:glycosyltransferase involved in cell wall biosynthesis
MIKVAFFLDFPLSYNGGVNYFKNVFFALNSFYKDKLEIILFVPSNIEDKDLSPFKHSSKIIKTNVLRRKSLSWFISKLFQKLINYDLLKKKIVSDANIDIVFYCNNFINLGSKIKYVNWIPDFQFLHYPQYWNEKQLKIEKNLIKKGFKNSDIVVLSSKDSLNDFLKINKTPSNKVKVINFVSQIDNNLYSNFNNLNKYSKDQFFYLPNQFWIHKNHLTVFKAVKILLEKNIEIKLLCSGVMKDFRSKDKYIYKLLKYVGENNLKNNIIFLDVIPYEHVLGLIKKSIAVINPSFFEGWSSTVEESKSLDKTIILSDIPIHREQNPAKGIFFNPNDPNELSKILKKLINSPPIFNFNHRKIEKKLKKRTKVFAEKYYEIFDELSKK